MLERCIGRTADPRPGLRCELETAEVAVPRVRRPRAFLQMHALRLREPRRGRAPLGPCGGPRKEEGGDTGDEHGAHEARLYQRSPPARRTSAPPAAFFLAFERCA